MNRPQDYSRRVPYRAQARWYRRLNKAGVLLTSLGLAPRGVVTLEVRGRTSGKVRRVPVLVTRHDIDDYLVALAGEAQWVRNVRAAGGHVVIRRRRARKAQLEEIPAEGRTEIIAAYLDAGRVRGGEQTQSNQARYYFGLRADPSIDEIGTIVEHYPVFRIDYTD